MTTKKPQFLRINRIRQRGDEEGPEEKLNSLAIVIADAAKPHLLKAIKATLPVSEDSLNAHSSVLSILLYGWLRFEPESVRISVGATEDKSFYAKFSDVARGCHREKSHPLAILQNSEVNAYAEESLRRSYDSCLHYSIPNAIALLRQCTENEGSEEQFAEILIEFRLGHQFRISTSVGSRDSRWGIANWSASSPQEYS